MNSKNTKTQKQQWVRTSPSQIKLVSNPETKFSKDCGAALSQIYHLLKNHEIKNPLKDKLRDCADDLWDLQIEDDAKSGNLTKEKFEKN